MPVVSKPGVALEFQASAWQNSGGAVKTVLPYFVKAHMIYGHGKFQINVILAGGCFVFVSLYKISNWIWTTHF